MLTADTVLVSAGRLAANNAVNQAHANSGHYNMTDTTPLQQQDENDDATFARIPSTR